MQTKPFHLFLRASIPGAIGMVASSIYFTLELLLIGRLVGQTAFAAANLVMPFILINFALSDLIAVGSSVRIAIKLGEGKKDEADNLFTVAVLSCMLINVLIGGLLILFSIAVEFLRGARQLPAGLRLFLMGTMEMTTGIRTLAAALPFPYSAAAACASLTFGGLSGILQTKAALGALAQKKKAGLSIRQYCAWKLLYACLTAAILLALEA